MRKKIITITITAALILGITACGTDTADTETKSTSNAAKNEFESKTTELDKTTDKTEADTQTSTESNQEETESDTNTDTATATEPDTSQTQQNTESEIKNTDETEKPITSSNGHSQAADNKNNSQQQNSPGNTSSNSSGSTPSNVPETKPNADMLKAQNELNEANQNLKAAQQAAENARIEADSANNAMLKAENAFNEAIKDGSLGYFEYVNADSAINALKNSKYASLTKIGEMDDATSLVNMKNSIQWMKECNSLRAKHNLPALNVTDELMACAQADANYSDTETAHALQFNIGENCAWNYGSNPFTQWYDGEKDEAERTGEYNNNTGHYFNIINSSFGITGFAICTRGTVMGWNTYVQTFNWDLGTDTVFSVDEYEKRFMEYYNKVVGSTETDYLAAVEAYNTAQSKLYEAENNVNNAEYEVKIK